MLICTATAVQKAHHTLTNLCQKLAPNRTQCMFLLQVSWACIRPTRLTTMSRSSTRCWIADPELNATTGLENGFEKPRFLGFYRALLRRARLSQYVVCLSSPYPSVTLRYDFHTGCNIENNFTTEYSLRLLVGLTPTWAIWCNGNTPKIGVE